MVTQTLRWKVFMYRATPCGIQFTGTAWPSLDYRWSRRRPELPTGPCRNLVQRSSKRHWTGALARHDSGSRRREKLVDHRSMAAISIRGESRSFGEVCLPVEGDRRAGMTRAVRCIHCCGQWPDDTQPRPWTGCALPRCCSSPPGKCGWAGCWLKG